MGSQSYEGQKLNEQRKRSLERRDKANTQKQEGRKIQGDGENIWPPRVASQKPKEPLLLDCSPSTICSLSAFSEASSLFVL